MKKILILAASVAGAVGAYAQGTVTFADYSIQTGGALQIQIYSPETGAAGATELQGNSAADIPSGAVVYDGVPLGGSTTGSGPTGYGNGANYTAQLFGAGGANQTTLSPLTQYTSTFYITAARAGLFELASPSSDTGIPNSSAGTATLALAAWYNGGGTITSLAAAEAAGVPYGMSASFNLSALGGTGSPPATPPILTGLTSFSLINPSAVPEPATITLGIIGAAAFLMRRRNQQ